MKEETQKRASNDRPIAGEKPTYRSGLPTIRQFAPINQYRRVNQDSAGIGCRAAPVNEWLSFTQDDSGRILLINNERHRMNPPDAPIAHQGFFVTHFFTVRDQEKSKDFYVRILGGR
jgi:hypothetical protein